MINSIKDIKTMELINVTKENISIVSDMINTLFSDHEIIITKPLQGQTPVKLIHTRTVSDCDTVVIHGIKIDGTVSYRYTYSLVADKSIILYDEENLFTYLNNGSDGHIFSIANQNKEWIFNH